MHGRIESTTTAEQGPPSSVPKCRAPRSMRLVGVEVDGALSLTAIVAGAAGLAASLLVAPDARGVLGAGLAIVAMAIAAIDARRFIIPDGLNVLGLALALVNAAILEPDQIAVAVATAILRGAALGLAFLAIRIAYGRLRGRDGIGLGDVKLAVVAGAWVDWFTMVTVVEIAALAALGVYGVRQVAMGRAMRPTNRLPFGLFLAPAIWLGWLLETTGLIPL